MNIFEKISHKVTAFLSDTGQGSELHSKDRYALIERYCVCAQCEDSVGKSKGQKVKVIQAEWVRSFSCLPKLQCISGSACC